MLASICRQSLSGAAQECRRSVVTRSPATRDALQKVLDSPQGLLCRSASASDMQSNQAGSTGNGTAGANSSASNARGPIAPRARGSKKSTAPDPRQPTLQQVFARVTAKPATGAASSNIAVGGALTAPYAQPYDISTSQTAHAQPPTLPQPTTTNNTSTTASSSCTHHQSHLAVTHPAVTDVKECGLLTGERLVVSLPCRITTNDTSAMHPKPTSLTASRPMASLAPTSSPRASPELASAAATDPDAPRSAVSFPRKWDSRFTYGLLKTVDELPPVENLLQPHAEEQSPAVTTNLAAVIPAVPGVLPAAVSSRAFGEGDFFGDQDQDVEVLSVRLARLRVKATAMTSETTSGDTNTVVPDYINSDITSIAATVDTTSCPTMLQPSLPERPHPLELHSAHLSFAASAKTAPTVQATETAPTRRRKAAAAEAMDSGAAAATAAQVVGRGRLAKTKLPRSGRAPGGTLLWTELSYEEREAAGGQCWIRWEPVKAAAASTELHDCEGVGGGDGPAPLFHLFSVDVETVDFMRGRQVFPRPDQVRLIELAAVDLGPFDSAAATAAAAAFTGFTWTSTTDPYVGGGANRVFSTLVNCGRSYKDHKTSMHNGIRWAESGAPGVPSTVEALQHLFTFISQRCAATAATASTAAAPSTPPPRVVPVLMAHNGAVFDFPVLRSECGRVGVEWPQDWWYLDTLLAAKALWAKADWPTKPAVVAGSGAEGAAVEEGAALEDNVDDVEEAGMDAGTDGGGKRSLSMDALKHWASVTGSGSAHRAAVDAVDLAAVWVRLWERWGRPSLEHLEKLSSGKGPAKTAAGPMHQLGLISLAARSDGLVRHMEEATAAMFLEKAPKAASPSASAPTCLVLSPSRMKDMQEGGQLQLGWSGSFGSLWIFKLLGEMTCGLQVGGVEGTCYRPSLVPFVVLLRGVKLRHMSKTSFSYKADHSPKWELVLAAGTGKVGEGATRAEELEEIVRLMDGMAANAAVQARGDAGQSAKVFSCGRADFKTGKMGLVVQLHAKLIRGPAQGQLQWKPLATLATYDKRTVSYRALSWPPLESYTPPVDAQLPAQQSQHNGGGTHHLQFIKEDILARIAAQLPDVASSDVLDVAVWPEFCWVNDTGSCGVRLKAVHLVRRKAT